VVVVTLVDGHSFPHDMFPLQSPDLQARVDPRSRKGQDESMQYLGIQLGFGLEASLVDHSLHDTDDAGKVCFHLVHLYSNKYGEMTIRSDC